MLKLVSEHNIILKTRTKEVKSIDEIEEYLPEMFEVMKASNGIGLSANQVGLNNRFFVSEIKGKKKVCINPKVLEEQNVMPGKEGCLSFPGINLTVRRSESVTVQYHDQNWNQITEGLTGLEARCFLHELDHLNGITFDTKVSKLALTSAKSKRKL